MICHYRHNDSLLKWLSFKQAFAIFKKRTGGWLTGQMVRDYEIGMKKGAYLIICPSCLEKLIDIKNNRR